MNNPYRNNSRSMEALRKFGGVGRSVKIKIKGKNYTGIVRGGRKGFPCVVVTLSRQEEPICTPFTWDAVFRAIYYNEILQG